MASTSGTAVPASGATTPTQPLAVAEEKLATMPALPTRALGISGTSNYAGRLYTEENERLQHLQGYGQPGVQEWGEYERAVRTDPHIAMALGFVLAPIRDATVDITPVDETPAEVAKADFLRWALLECGEPGYAEFVSQVVERMLGGGFALFEPTLRANVRHPSLPGGRGYTLGRLAERLPSSVHVNGWLKGPDGELLAVKQHGPKDDASGRWLTVELPASSLLLFTWQRDGDNYAGRSAFRSVAYIAWVRAQLLKLVAISYQREGAGIPIAFTADPDAKLSPEQRADMQALLGNIVFHENANAIMPAGWNIQWVFSPGANKGHVVQAWLDLGLVILQTLQAQQMVLGTHNTGSRAVGEVHFASSQVFVQGVLANLEGALNGIGLRPYTGLVRRLVDANWGPQERYPRLTLTLKKGSLEPASLAAAVTALVTAGALHPRADDENRVREALGWAPLDAEEFAEIEAKEEAAEAAGQALALAQAKQPPPPPGAPPLKQEPKAEAPVKAARTGPFAPGRPLRPLEARLDLARMDSFLNTARDDFEAACRPLVVEMLTRAAPSIKHALKDGDPGELTKLALDTTRLAAAVSDFVEAARAEGKAQVVAEMRKGTTDKLLDSRAAGSQALAPVVHAAMGDGGAAPASKTLQSIKDALVRRLTGRIRHDLEQDAIDALRTGDDAESVIARTVTDQLETGALKGDASSVLTRVWNVGRDEGARMMDASEAEYSAILDGHQCDSCDEMDGRTFEMGTPEYEDNLPPNRDCDGGGKCRCMYAYVPGSASDDGEDA